MRHLLCVLLVCGPLFAQAQYPPAADSSRDKGSFYVEGIVYQYATSARFTVVTAVHSAMNRKFAALKVRVYNADQRSVTLKPEDILVEDAVASRAVVPLPAGELAGKMRKPYNMARYAVGGGGATDSQGPVTADMLNPQLLEMMRAMAARSHGGSVAAAGDNLLYTDTPGALEDEPRPRVQTCDQVCRLRAAEAQDDPLAQLQKQASPDYVEQCGLRANTIPPRGNIGGVLYLPMGKLEEERPTSSHMKKRRIVRVTVPVEEEKFQFVLVVE